MDLVDVALGVPATRRSLLRRVLIVGLGAVVSLGLAIGCVVQLQAARAADELQREGVRTSGTVIARAEWRVGARGQYPDGTVTVRYEVDGGSHEAVVAVGTDIVNHHEGDTVTMVVDPDDPSRAWLEDATPFVAGVPWAVLGFLALAFGAMAFVAGRTLRRLHRAVSRSPWLFVRSQLHQVPLDGRMRGSRTLVRLELPDGDVWVEPIGLNRVDPSFEPEAWVAGLELRTQALAPQGGGHVVAVRRRRAPFLVLDDDTPSRHRRGDG